MLEPTELSETRNPAAGLDWSLLRSFAAVMRKGSLSAAAAAIGQTQPTIGRHIRALEDIIGEELFLRRGNGISPTPRASALFERAMLMEEAALAIDRLVAGGQEDVSGTIRLSVPEMFGQILLPGLLAEFQLLHPKVAIELAATNETDDLIRREADIAVRFFRPTQPDLVMTKAGIVYIGVFAAPSYVERFGIPGSAAEFKTHRLIGDDNGNRILAAMKSFGLPIKRSDFCFRSDSTAVQMAAVEAGIGIGSGMTLAFDRNKVRRILTHAVNLPFEVYVVAHADLHRSRRIRALYDHLVEKLRQDLAASAQRDEAESRTNP